MNANHDPLNPGTNTLRPELEPAWLTVAGCITLLLSLLTVWWLW